MEEKKYEAGKVEISSSEYRDLIKDMVEAQMRASEARSEKWRVESERDKLSQELALANKKIEELKSKIRDLQTQVKYGSLVSNPTTSPTTSPKPWWTEVTCMNLHSNNTEDK